jgi:hypothetical protein
MDSHLVSRVAYCPKGSVAPIELISVTVPIGELSHKAWLDALAERVSDMLANNPNRYSDLWLRKACERCGFDGYDGSDNLGLFLVKRNFILQAFIECSLSNENFLPAFITCEDIEAKKAIESTDLEAWVKIAENLINGKYPKNFSDVYLRLLKEERENDPKLVPEEEMKPLIKYAQCMDLYIERHLNDDGDQDGYEASSGSYDLNFRIHKVENSLQFFLLVGYDRSFSFKSKAQIEQLIVNFNCGHSLKITDTHIYKNKKSFYSWPRYLPSHYWITFQMDLHSDLNLINESMALLYLDLLSFFSEEALHPVFPKPEWEEEPGENFLTYIKDQLLALEVVKKYPNIVTGNYD